MSESPVITYSTDFIANQYNNRIDWIKVFTIIYNLGSTLNSRKLRFFKSDIIEHSHQFCSNRNSIIWVDDIGRDLHDSELDIDIEVKYSNNCMYNKSNKPKKTVSLKIKNSLGKQKSNVIKDPADYYMIIQQNAVGIISYTDLRPYLVNTGDGIQAKIPFGKITIINKQLDMIFEVVECSSFKDEIDRARVNYITNICNCIDQKRNKLATPKDVSTEDKDKKLKKLRDELVILEEEKRKKEEEIKKILET